MKLAAMQPYFFPYLGYFDLINLADVWIVYDGSQYVRRGWMNRNRILDPVRGWRYIRVPVAGHALTTPLGRILIAPGADWRGELFKALEPYRREAPEYDRVRAFLESCLSPAETGLSRLNARLLLETCRYLGIRTPFHWFAPDAFPELVGLPAQDLAVGLCRAFGADEYVNRPGGAAQFDPAAFRDAGLRLTIQSFLPMAYDCGRFAHVPDLSILDVLMWNPPEAIKRYLDGWRSEKERLL